MAEVRVRRFAGEAAVTLDSGELAATFLPEVGMLGVSLRTADGASLLALPGGVRAARAGRTTGLPLLHPWANRLARRRYTVCGTTVDLRRVPLHTDGHGRPIHGTMVGRAGWTVRRCDAAGRAARLAARFEHDATVPDLLRAFPFPHRLDVEAVVRGATLTVTTTVTPTSTRAVPVSFGWHPYLRLPSPRSQWRLRVPRGLVAVPLDRRGIPTTGVTRAPPGPGRVGGIGGGLVDGPVGGLVGTDALCRLGRGRTWVLTDDERAVTVRFARPYAYAQLWVPAGRPFLAIEPMTAPTNALVDGAAPSVAPGETFRAAFDLGATRRGGA